MFRWRRESLSKPADGRGSLKTIINCLYSMILASILGVASATYFYVIGPRNVVALTGITVTFAASALNLSYLVLHHVLSWRYARDSASFYRQHNNTLHSSCMMLSGMVLVAWLTSSIMGLVGASKAPFCSKNAPATLMWKTLDGCKIQRASVAGSLLNLLNSCVLCYALKSSDRPFAASSTGISSRNHKEEELDFSSRSSFATTFVEKSLGIRSFSTPVTPTPQPRGRRSWLPRLEFEPPPAYQHPPFQHGFDQMVLALSQTNLLPRSLPRQTTNHSSRPPYSRSYTAESPSNISRPTLGRRSSSVYSQSTSAETDILNSPRTASQTDHQNTRSASIRSEVAIPVPAIPESYLYKSHTLRNGGRPVRPASRPSLPPADFWTYAQEQQTYDALPQSHSQAQQREGRLAIWPGEDVILQPRLRVQSVGPKRSQTCTDSPTGSATRPIAAGSISPGTVRLASPDKAVLRRNMDKENINVRIPGRKETESYDKLRKGEDEGGMNFERLDWEFSPSKVLARKDSWTFVKMKQTQDSPPKIPLKSEARGKRL